MLIGEGLTVGGVKGDVLGGAVEGGTESEQFPVGAPAGTLLGFLTQIPQEGYGLLTESLGVLR